VFIIGQQTQDLSSEDWGLNDNCAEMNGTPMAYMCQCCALAEWLLQKVYRPTIVGLAGVPWGRFLLLPSLRIFAAVTGPGAEQTEAGEDLSPEKVLNEDPFHARYQRLGNESLLGRSTVKYKVTVERGAETVIWIDESIGMPVRSETSYSDAQHSAKTTMELKDIRLEVDPELFLLPPDYRKATSAEEFEKLRIGRPHQK